MFNQYQYPQMPQINQYPQMRQYGTMRQETVIRVNGKGGVDAYQMMPNSSVLLLDETAPIVWLVQTDGAGYKTSQAYEIKPYEQKAPVDTNSLEERIARLEATIYAKSDVKSTEQQTATYQHDSAVPAIQAADAGQGSPGNRYGSIE